MSRTSCAPRAAADLWELGWLPFHAACDELGCSPSQFGKLVRDGDIPRRSIGPGLYLYAPRKVF